MNIDIILILQTLVNAQGLIVAYGHAIVNQGIEELFLGQEIGLVHIMEQFFQLMERINALFYYVLFEDGQQGLSVVFYPV